MTRRWMSHGRHKHGRYHLDHSGADRGLYREQNRQQDRLRPDIGPRARDGRRRSEASSSPVALLPASGARGASRTGLTSCDASVRSWRELLGRGSGLRNWNCHGGGVSAGAYTAGVIDFLFEALDEYKQARGQPVTFEFRSWLARRQAE
jgi:hypothetical protein